MEAKELRLGNLVFDTETEKDDIITAIEENRVSLKNAKLIYTPIDFIEPIKLTEEWLLKFGFKKYEWMTGYFIKTKFGDLMIQFYKERIILYFTNIGADSTGMKMMGRKYIGNTQSTENVKYVHQLQNLYFALTGKELEIK